MSELHIRTEWIQRLSRFLEEEDFGKNWDGAYQDALPTLRRYLDAEGFQTDIVSEWDSASRETELVATSAQLVVRIPWAQDYHGRSIVDLKALIIQSQRDYAVE